MVCLLSLIYKRLGQTIALGFATSSLFPCPPQGEALRERFSISVYSGIDQCDYPNGRMEEEGMKVTGATRYQSRTVKRALKALPPWVILSMSTEEDIRDISLFKFRPLYC